MVAEELPRETSISGPRLTLLTLLSIQGVTNSEVTSVQLEIQVIFSGSKFDLACGEIGFKLKTLELFARVFTAYSYVG